MGISLKDSFQIQTSVRPSVQFQSPLSPDLASIGTQNMQKMGEGLQALGKGLVQADVEALNKATNLRIKDNLNKLDHDMFDLTYGNPEKGIRGYTDFKGGDIFDKEALNGMPLQSKYYADYENKIGEYEATLPDYAKQKFREQALSKGLQLKQNSMLWADKQAKQYEVSVYQDLITNTSFALAKAQTPEEASQLLLQLDEGYTGLGVATGQGVDADKRKAISNALSNATYNKISEGDLNEAIGFYNVYKDKFEVDDAVRVDKAFQTANKQAFINDAGVFAKATLIDQINENGDLIKSNFEVIEKIEGGVTPKGVALVSSKGAIGVSQILPTTAKEVAQKNNIPFDEDKLKTDNEYNKTLGLLYYKEQLKTFDNDFLKAGVAYNGGPVVVKKAIEASEADIKIKKLQGIVVADPANHWQNFLEYDESKKYLEKLKQNTPTQFGKKTFPSEDQFLSNVASKSPENLSLEQQKEVIDMAKGVYKLAQIEYSSRQDNVLGELMSSVKMGQNIDVLKFQELNPENQEKLNKFASNQRQGKNTVTNPKLFYDFVKDDQRLKNTDLNAYADQLNANDLNFLQSKQKELISFENDQIKLSKINGDTKLINQQIAKDFKNLKEKDPEYVQLYQKLSNLISESKILKGKDLTEQETIALLNQATSKIIFDSVTQIPLYGDLVRQKETTAQNFNGSTNSIVLSPKDAQEITTIFQLENNKLPKNDAELKDFYLSYKRRAGVQ